MEQEHPGKPLRCWLTLHVWVTRVNGGARWQECDLCGKYAHRVAVNNRFPPGGTGDGAGGFGGGGV